MKEAAWKWVGAVGGVTAFGATLLFGPPEGLSNEAWRVLGVALLMGFFWVFEPVPYAVTALLPAVIFPLAGVATVERAAAPYASPIMMLFLGGILIALGMERWNLHRRIAVAVIRGMGTRPASVVLGFLLASAFLSMWINNTATTVMMLPIAVSVIGLLDRASGGRVQKAQFAPALVLSVAYGSNIGGTATLIGTAPNALFAGFVQENFGVEIGFVQWMFFALPVALVALPLTLWVLSRVAFRLPGGKIHGAADVLRSEAEALGPQTGGERAVAVVFGITVALWLSRPVLPVPGLSDAVIAMLGGLSLFFIPAGPEPGGRVMDWETARKIPWEVLILIGGALSLAAAMQETGLAGWIGGLTRRLDFLPFPALAAIVASVILTLTEFTSNTAATAAFLPIASASATAMGENPILLAAVVAVAASGAFMLPVATPPNAIAFGTGLVSVRQMIKAGFLINLIFLSVLVAAVTLLGQDVLPAPAPLPAGP